MIYNYTLNSTLSLGKKCAQSVELSTLPKKLRMKINQKLLVCLNFTNVSGNMIIIVRYLIS